MFGLETFKRSPLGVKVGEVLTDRDNIIRMTTLTEHGMPAVQAVGKRLMAVGDEVGTDENKKIIGRWVREILDAEGLEPKAKGRVAAGNLFSTGAIYGPK